MASISVNEYYLYRVIYSVLSSHLSGLTLEESTDIPTLQRELNKVDQQIKQLSISKRSKFTERQHKEELKVIYHRWKICAVHQSLALKFEIWQ